MKSFQCAHLFEHTETTLERIKPLFATAMVNVYRSKGINREVKAELIDSFTALEQAFTNIKDILEEL